MVLWHIFESCLLVDAQRLEFPSQATDFVSSAPTIHSKARKCLQQSVARRSTDGRVDKGIDPSEENYQRG
jgi:hypothetical protein